MRACAADRGAQLRGDAARLRRRAGGERRAPGARSPDGGAQVEQAGTVSFSSGDRTAERDAGRCAQVPAETAPVPAAHQQHRCADWWILPGEMVQTRFMARVNVKD